MPVPTTAITTTTIPIVAKITISRRARVITVKVATAEEVAVVIAVIIMAGAMETAEVAAEDIATQVLTVEVNIFFIFFVIEASQIPVSYSFFSPFAC